MIKVYFLYLYLIENIIFTKNCLFLLIFRKPKTITNGILKHFIKKQIEFHNRFLRICQINRISKRFLIS